MNSKLLLLSFIMLLTMVTNHAQTSAEQAGIAVQGIARDETNTAISTGAPINFKFTIYYKDGQDYNVHEESISLETDSFGVFSHVLDVDYEKNSAFSHNQMYLRIEAGSPLIKISDEQLKHVPYAVSANNGVPMGSIMPFLGDQAPAGWVLCHGQTWASVGANGEKLKAFLGNPSSVPNLQGMFLRGTGTNPVNNQAGPTLNATQADGFKSHLHNKGTIAVSEGGTHKHAYYDSWRQHMGDDQGDDQDQLDNDYRAQNTLRETPNFDGKHKHDITGSTGGTGISETRPVNHGVNYIIKL